MSPVQLALKVDLGTDTLHLLTVTVSNFDHRPTGAKIAFNVTPKMFAVVHVFNSRLLQALDGD